MKYTKFSIEQMKVIQQIVEKQVKIEKEVLLKELKNICNCEERLLTISKSKTPYDIEYLPPKRMNMFDYS